MARSLAGFEGPVALVNARSAGSAAGFDGSVAAAVDRLQAPIDLAVVCVPAAATADAVEEAAKAGARAALVCSGGFGESGAAGATFEADLRDVVQRTGIRLLGPNTSGFVVPRLNLRATFVPSAQGIPAGRIAVVAASGGVNHALAFMLAEAGHGVSLAVGLGNAVDVTAADVLDHLAEDDETSAVALHLESVQDGARLADAVRRLSTRVPVVALVVGRNDVAEFAQSHTGALATSWRTTRAVLRQSGAVLVDDDRQLVDAVVALSCTRLRPAADPGVGIVTAQAGPGLLLLDALKGNGIRVPELSAPSRERLSDVLPPMTYQRNPVDTGRPGEGFAEVLGTVAADPAVDLLAVYALAEPNALDLPSAMEAAGLAGSAPVLVGVGGTREDAEQTRCAMGAIGVPVASSVTTLANGVRALVEDSRAAHRGQQEGEELAPLPPLDLAAGADGWDEDRAKSLVAELGFGTMPRRACATREAAHAALADLGGPVAVKLLDAQVLHKTDVGGVHLGIRTAAELDDALTALEKAGARRFLVEAMAGPGVDLIVAARRDPVFGPVVMLGLGGTVAEALADVSLRSAPVTVAEAATMPDDLLAAPLLDGWRGGPAVDRAELGRLLQALGGALVDHPALQEIEINPLRATASGLLALDAVVMCEEDS
jgi:acetyltransferase